MAARRTLPAKPVNNPAATLQVMLNMHGAGLRVDGIIGDKTKAAISQFQRQNGLAVTGLPTDQTIAALHQPATPPPAPHMRPPPDMLGSGKPPSATPPIPAPRPSFTPTPIPPQHPDTGMRFAHPQFDTVRRLNEMLSNVSGARRPPSPPSHNEQSLPDITKNTGPALAGLMPPPPAPQSGGHNEQSLPDIGRAGGATLANFVPPQAPTQPPPPAGHNEQSLPDNSRPVPPAVTPPADEATKNALQEQILRMMFGMRIQPTPGPFVKQDDYSTATPPDPPFSADQGQYRR